MLPIMKNSSTWYFRFSASKRKYILFCFYASIYCSLETSRYVKGVSLINRFWLENGHRSSKCPRLLCGVFVKKLYERRWYCYWMMTACASSHLYFFTFHHDCRLRFCQPEVCWLTHWSMAKWTQFCWWFFFKCLFLEENSRLLIWISLKFVRRFPIDNESWMIKVMASCRTSTESLSDYKKPWCHTPHWHICVTKHQWVKIFWFYTHYVGVPLICTHGCWSSRYLQISYRHHKTGVDGAAVPRSSGTHHRCPWVPPLLLPVAGGRVTQDWE